MENRFSIGEKVVAITSPKDELAQPRKKGEIYVVKDVRYCPTDGHQMINLGYPVSPDSSGKIACSCGKRHHANGLMWTNSKHFAKIDYSSLKEAVDEENYELACIIRDNLI